MNKRLLEQEQAELNNTLFFVMNAHNGQFRKGSGIPFVFHVLSVFDTLRRWGIYDNIVYKASLAHDILEDCPEVSEEELAKVIGEDALRVVKELTFIPNPEVSLRDSEQKKHYMEKVGTKSIQALVIKMSDRINNTKDFICEGGDYAIKYWIKARPLFDAFFNRKDEVIQVYGGFVFFEIFKQYNDVCQNVTILASLEETGDVVVKG